LIKSLQKKYKQQEAKKSKTKTIATIDIKNNNLFIVVLINNFIADS